MATIRELDRGAWLDESVPEEFRHDVQMLCHLLSDCVADLVVSLAMFEQALVGTGVRMQVRSDAAHDHEQWRREGERPRAREKELDTQPGIACEPPGYFESSEAVRERVRGVGPSESSAHERVPESYARRIVFIHAQSFVSTLAILQRSLLALTRYSFEPDVAAELKRAADCFAGALPGLKGVRDSVAHVEERVRREAHGKKINTQPVWNSSIHAPGGAMVVSALIDQHFGGTIADGTYAKVEVADATTEVARAAVQAVYDALPWRPGHRHREPSS